MLTTALLVSSSALLTWPDVGARRRAALRSTTTRFPGALLRYALALLILAMGAVVAGLGGLCAAATVVSLGIWWVKSRVKSRHRLHVHAELAAALRLVVAELRTGAPTATAAETVAAETETEVAEVFRRIAVASRL